jgi:GT2 family glycosyltransferase
MESQTPRSLPTKYARLVTVIVCNSISECRSEVGTKRDALVVVPVYNNYDDFVRCIGSIDKHTPSTVDLVIVDDCGGDRRFLNLLQYLEANRRTIVLKMAANSGFVGACNAAIEATGDRDIIFVNSDIVVGPEWYERLCDAAKSSNVIATASTLTNHGTMLSAPTRNLPSRTLDNSDSLDHFILNIAKKSLRLRPTIPTAVGHCFYVKRSALNVCGGFSDDFGKGYGEEVDLSQRMIKAGFRHICADDVFVFHRGGGTFGASRHELQDKNHQLIKARYPYYEMATKEASASSTTQLALAVQTISIGLEGLRIAIDGRCLGPLYMGTQQVVVETARALSRRSEVSRIQLHVPHNISIATLEKLADQQKIELCYPDTLAIEPADIAYRPYQAINTDDLAFLRRIGNRVVINHLDLIAYFNPFYFENYESWSKYRESTSDVLRLVDGIAFISDTVRTEVEQEGLVSPEIPLKTIYCGTDLVSIIGCERPGELRGVREKGFILSLGAAYAHKNRLLSLKLLRDLKNQGWDGALVLAGATPPDGSSLGAEAEYLLKESDLSESIITLGAVSDEQRRWLFENCAFVVYLSTVEGFGFVPFEAASLGAPCLSSRGGSLAEVLPEEFVAVQTFDRAEITELAWRLLTDQTFVEQQIKILREQREIFTWDRTVGLLLELFQDVCRRLPPREVSQINKLETDLRRAHENLRLEGQKTEHFRSEVSRLEMINQRLNQANSDLNRANSALYESNVELSNFNDRLILGNRAGTWTRWLSWPARRALRRARNLFSRSKKSSGYDADVRQSGNG